MKVPAHDIAKGDAFVLRGGYRVVASGPPVRDASDPGHVLIPVYVRDHHAARGANRIRPAYARFPADDLVDVAF